MERGAFTFLAETLPELRAPHVLASVRPWVDVGNVGTLVLGDVEAALKAEPLARLTKPGTFFDFTRYRPTAYFKEGQREVELPNAVINYARGPGANDFLFFHLLEPHANGEDFVYSLLDIMTSFGATRYFMVGAMYDMVPHTRPLLISGSASDQRTQQTFANYGVRTSQYQGPTTILTLLAREAARKDMDSMSLIVRLPQYAPLEEDHTGRLRLLKLLDAIYPLRLPVDTVEALSEEQLRQVNAAVESNPQLKRVLQHLEERYESENNGQDTSSELPPLPPSIEKFLREMEP